MQGFSRIAAALILILKTSKKAKSKNLFKFKKTIGSLDFFISGAKLAFTKLWQMFFKALILHYFDPEHHIRNKTDVSDYATGGIFSQLISDNLSQWHLVAFFSQKMIPAENPQSADFRRFEPMTSGSLLLSKDDSSKDQVWNSWQWTFSHRWGFQDLKALSKRLST